MIPLLAGFVMPFLLWLIFSIAEVGHERELEKDLLKKGYSKEDNKQRKRWKMLMLGAFALSVSQFDPIAFLWCAWSFWFIHEFGLSVARGDVSKFGTLGTTSDVDVVLGRIFGPWAMRTIIVIPLIVLSYWRFDP